MRAISIVVLLIVLSSSVSSAWSFEVHRLITSGAVDLLPPEMRPFYDKYRPFVVEHSVDPDLWRSAGFAAEPPNHFLDLDAYGQPPFSALPRDFSAAVARYGRQSIDKNGRLPWRVTEFYDKLRGAFQDVRTGKPGYAYEDAMFFAAVLSHYVADGHVPFHATVNYDGRLTGQSGIHERFEEELFRRYRQRLGFAPRAVKPITAPRDFMFETLAASVALVEPILQADRGAVRNRTSYDEGYFDQFFGSTKPVLEQRISEAMTGVASLLVGAWIEGGRPTLPLDPPARLRGVTEKAAKN